MRGCWAPKGGRGRSQSSLQAPDLEGNAGLDWGTGSAPGRWGPFRFLTLCPDTSRLLPARGS